MGKRWAAVLLAAMLMLSAAACMAPESGPPSAVSSADSADSAQGTAAPDDSASVPDAPTTAPADPEASDSAENAEKNDLTMPTITDEQAAAWFADAVFVGNSRVQGLVWYTGVEADMIAERGLNVITALHDDATTLENGEKGSVLDALAQKPYGKVYVKFGMNELNWMAEEVFVQYYGRIVDGIREVQPQAAVFVQSILPIARERSEASAADGGMQTQERVNQLNGALRAMCLDKGVRFLDAEQAVMDPDGYLYAEYAASDGYHLNAAGCEKWLDYLKQAVNPYEMEGE